MSQPSPETAPRIPQTNWWMVSGLMIAVGGISIGIGFVVLGTSIFSTSGSPDYLAGFYTLVGIGIAFIGLSWLFARMSPRIKQPGGS